MWRPIEEAPYNKLILVTGKTPYKEVFFFYVMKTKQPNSDTKKVEDVWMHDDAVMIVTPTHWLDDPNPAEGGTTEEGPVEQYDVFDCESTGCNS